MDKWGKETYQIKDYFHDEAVAFVGALNPKGKLACNKDEMYSNECIKLVSYNAEDTIPVGTFLEKKSTKKIDFYVASFTESHWEAAHQEVYSLFPCSRIKNGIIGKNYLGAVIV